MKEPPKLVVAGPPNGDDAMHSNMMGNFVKGYFRKGANASPSLDQFLADEVHPVSRPPREVCSMSLESMESSVASASEDLQETSKQGTANRTDNGKIGKYVKNFLGGGGSAEDAAGQASLTQAPQESKTEDVEKPGASASENLKGEAAPSDVRAVDA